MHSSDFKFEYEQANPEETEAVLQRIAVGLKPGTPFAVDFTKPRDRMVMKITEKSLKAYNRLLANEAKSAASLAEIQEQASAILTPIEHLATVPKDQR